MIQLIEVVPYNPEWVQRFNEQAPRIAQALGPNCLAVHHIGSTSIPGICAKDILDVLVAVQEIERVDERNSFMAELGYEFRGEYGIPGRRYFVRGNAVRHTQHVHIFQHDHPDITRHLVFRDYMIAHPEDAQAYSQLKQTLAQQFRGDPEGYMDGKDAFIQEMDRRARAWSEKRGSVIT